jgi:hypothetical protein
MASRIILLLSPLLFLFPAALMAAGYRVSSYVACFLAISVVSLLVRWYADQNNRDGRWWGLYAVCFPIIVPIVLALLPQDPNSAGALLRAGHGRGPANGAGGGFEERLPLLTQFLEGQPEAVRADMTARFREVKTSFEFLLTAKADAVARLLAEARERGLITWSGTDGSGPLIYGAGLAPPSGVEEAGDWLDSAGAPGGKLTIAHRDEDGLLRFIEHRFERATGAKA